MARIEAQIRTGTGKGVARKMRVTGTIPAVAYGAGQPNQLLALPVKEFIRLLQSAGDALRSTAHDLVVDGARVPVLIRDVQFHPISDLPIHVDFLRFDPSLDIEVQVPVKVVGEATSPGVKLGGIVQIVIHELTVFCKAGDIPNHIDVDISQLAIGHSIHVSELKLPAGIEVRDEPESAVVAISKSKADAEEPAAG